MTAKFGATSTTDDVLAGLDLKDKRVLVTGTSSGLGIETARALVAHGAYVVGTARDLNKAYAATGAVRAAAATSGGFELIEVDLGSLASVRACTDTLLLQAEPFDVVIANAGVMATLYGHSADFETQLGTNHLGHFVLVNRLAPWLLAGSRVVVLSSGAHRMSDIDLEDLRAGSLISRWWEQRANGFPCRRSEQWKSAWKTRSCVAAIARRRSPCVETLPRACSRRTCPPPCGKNCSPSSPNCACAAGRGGCERFHENFPKW